MFLAARDPGRWSPHLVFVLAVCLRARRVSEVANAETAHLVAAAVQAALQADAPQLPRRRPRVPAGDCEPLF